MDLRDPANGDSLLPPPSAKVLPPILQRKLERQLRQHHNIIVAPIKASIHESAKSSSLHDADRIYTADELEDELQRVSDAMRATQHHINIAENVYYEETHSHGNVFTGWDGYIDNRDISSHANNSHGGGASSLLYAAGGGGSHLLRKIPQDYKWFSSTTTTDSHVSEPSKYLSQTESDGKPVTVMSKEEAAAMKLQSNQMKDAAAAAQDKSDKCPSRRDDDATEQEEVAAEPLTDETTTTEEDGKQTDKKNKRKATAPPPVSTRSKRTRK